MLRQDVPSNGLLYFFDSELWLAWEDPDELPGPQADPLQVKVVRPQHLGETVLIHDIGWTY